MRMQPNARIAGFEFCSEKIMVGRVIFFALDKYLGFLLCLLRGVCIPRLFRHVLSGMFFLNGLVFFVQPLKNCKIKFCFATG